MNFAGDRANNGVILSLAAPMVSKLPFLESWSDLYNAALVVGEIMGA